MSFATLQSRVNATAVKRLGEPVLLGGEEVSGIFDNGFALGNVGAFGMASTEPKLVMLSADIPPRVIEDWNRWFSEPFDAVEQHAVVNGVTYKIVAIEPAGTGLSVLRLESVA